MRLSPCPRVVSGKECPEAIDGFLTRERIRSLVVVTGPHVSRLPEFEVLREACARGGRAVAVFDRTTADPSFDVVRSAAAFARDHGARAVVGVGGGSPLDAAKVVAALLSNDVDVADLVGADRVVADPVPLVAVPTTAGTGSEVTNVAVLTDVAANLKRAVLSDLLVPRLALLWPELTLGLPPATTAATGMDALCHASEAVLSLKRNPASDALAFGALSRIAAHLPRVIADPSDLASREAMMEASLMAGLAFNNSSVTAVHAFAYPLGGRFHMAHGLANSLMFAPVMRHGQPSEPERYAELARAFAGVPDALAFVPSVERMRRALPLPSCLREAGIPEDSLEAMSDDVMTVERLLSVNPRPVSRQDAGRIYREAWEGAPP